MEKLTPEIVQRLWAHMAWRYGAKVVQKSLAYYGCSDLDISVTLKSYGMVCAILASGGTLTKIGRYVIRFLHENGVK